MKRISPLIFLLTLALSSFSQEVSTPTRTVIESLRAINELSFEDLKVDGKSTPQYLNYKKLLNTATPQELKVLAQDTNQVVKGYVCLAMLETKHESIEKEFVKLVKDQNRILTTENGVENTVYLYDFIRYRTSIMSTSRSIKNEDKKYYQNLYLNLDSIVILNYTWQESDILMDYIIEMTEKEKNSLSKRKRWLANSFFIHQIAKEGDEYLYGKECGYPATKPYLRVVVEAALLDSNLDRANYFDKWISCDLFVIKVYGAEALIRLHNQGVELTPFQIRTINELKVSYKSVQICNGYFRERKSVRRALSSYNFQ